MESAPRLADGAAKLWNAVTRKRRDKALEPNAKAVAESAQSETEILKKRLVAMEEHVVSLQDQMGASTELIKALAEQNTQLVRRIEQNSVRILRLATATAIGAVLVVGTIAYVVLSRP
jgi:predicted  nucleic acid-binding Zn-ribbon protein